MDPVEAWEMLKRRVNVEYYIGARRVAAIDSRVGGGAGGGTTPPQTLGVDVDNDGQVDATYTKDE